MKTATRDVGAVVDMPSYGACAAFGVLTALVMALLKSTLRASVNELLPYTLVVYGLAMGILGLSSRSLYWRSAFSLAVLLCAPLLWTTQPHTNQWSTRIDLYCQTPPWSERFFDVFLFPVVSAGAGAGGFVAGVVSSLALRGVRWAPIARPIRWLAMAVTFIIVIVTFVKAHGRGSVDGYLASRPVVAKLFPAEDISKLPDISDGPVRVVRACDKAGCSVKLHTLDSSEPTYEGVGCIDERESHFLRHDEALGLWIVDVVQPDRRAKLHVAFRLNPKSTAGVEQADVTTLDILRVTRPPGGWILILVAGLVVAIYADRRRAREATLLLALERGEEGAVSRGILDGGLKHLVNTHLFGAVSLVPAASPSPGGYRKNAEPADTTVTAQGNTREELMGAAQRRMLVWDLYGLTVVVLALLAIGPWLRELVRAW